RHEVGDSGPVPVHLPAPPGLSAAALAGAPGGDPAEDPEALFGRTVRRVLGALLAAGTPD
ncbi:hypothetical protein ABZ630_30715, partial [Streptomyces albidoflavus]